MIKYIEVNGEICAAIIVKYLSDDEGVKRLHKSLIDITTSCLSSEKIKYDVSAESFQNLTYLIDATTIDSSEEPYDNADADCQEVINLYTSVFCKETESCSMLSTYRKNRISDIVRQYGLDTIKQVFQYIKGDYLATVKISLSHCISPVDFNYWYKMMNKKKGGEV